MRVVTALLFTSKSGNAYAEIRKFGFPHNSLMFRLAFPSMSQNKSINANNTLNSGKFENMTGQTTLYLPKCLCIILFS